jgi:hypothetical protein
VSLLGFFRAPLHTAQALFSNAKTNCYKQHDEGLSCPRNGLTADQIISDASFLKNFNEKLLSRMVCTSWQFTLKPMA